MTDQRRKGDLCKMNQRMKSRREKVKMIGLDLDGTLLNDKKEVGSYTEKC